MACIDCGAQSLTPLCSECAHIAVAILGDEDTRIKLLNKEGE